MDFPQFYFCSSDSLCFLCMMLHMAIFRQEFGGNLGDVLAFKKKMTDSRGNKNENMDDNTQDRQTDVAGAEATDYICLPFVACRKPFRQCSGTSF